MLDEIFPIFTINGLYSEPEYLNLTKEEKANLEYVDKCLFSENENINNASFHIMLLLIELSNMPDKYGPEELSNEFDKILNDLSNDERKIINNFIPACVNSMGIYSEERKKERKLKKERIDK